MLYLARCTADADDCTGWPLIIHGARESRKYQGRVVSCTADAARNLKAEERLAASRSPLVTARRIRVFTASRQGEENYGKEEAVSLTQPPTRFYTVCVRSLSVAAHTTRRVRAKPLVCELRNSHIKYGGRESAYRVSSSVMYNASDFLPS